MDSDGVRAPNQYSTPLTDHYPSSVVLAAAVIRRALQDLTITGIPHHMKVRQDAHDFLNKRLWAPDCLWQRLLSSVLNRRDILLSVKKRCYLDKYGKVLPVEEETYE